jgi:NagD protein
MNVSPKNYLIDMDGVLVRGGKLVSGADRFMDKIRERGRNYLVLTNTPTHTPGDLSYRFHTLGLEIPKEKIFTSAMATAMFLQSQKPRARAFVIGETGLTEAIHAIGYVITEHNPHFVVLGETHSYHMESIKKAVRLIADGACFIATNPDPTDSTEEGLEPACGALAALVERATGVRPYFVGKPNPLMMRTALKYLGVHSEETVMIGDRMDTDVVAGVESGIETILVLTGVTRREDVDKYPYRPSRIVGSVDEIEP